MLNTLVFKSYANFFLLDLKLDNIMVTFEDESVIEAFVQGQTTHPMARKTVGERTVYRCHNDFGCLKGSNDAIRHMYPKITDFGLTQRGINLDRLSTPSNLTIITPLKCSLVLGGRIVPIYGISVSWWAFLDFSSVFAHSLIASRCGISSRGRGYSTRKTRSRRTLQHNI